MVFLLPLSAWAPSQFYSAFVVVRIPNSDNFLESVVADLRPVIATEGLEPEPAKACTPVPYIFHFPLLKRRMHPVVHTP